MKLKKNVAVSESGFIFDPNTGDSFNVNDSGKYILKLLAQGRSIDEITQDVLKDFEIEAIAFQRYMDDFSILLRQFNLLEDDDN